MSEEAVIKSGEMDPRFKYEVAKIPGGERLMRCFQCGTCTADCPIARFSDNYRPRRIIRMMQLGLKERLLKSDFIWLCAACYTCVDRCPQNVELAHVFRVLRNLAVKEGYMPRVFKDMASTLLKTGYIYQIPDIRLEEREEDGLPPLPRVDLESFKKLFDATGFSKLMGR